MDFEFTDDQLSLRDAVARWVDKGFGFDPMFMPDGFDITFGEMPSSAKHSWARGQVGLSHRARAFAKFVEGAIEQS